MSLDKILAVLFGGGFMALIFVLVFKEYDKDTITVMVQALIGFVGVIVGFIWGSSQGSRDKDRQLGDVVTQNSKDEI